MALNDYETSPERGQPVELYQFVYGTNPGNFYAHTDGESDVIHAGVTYTRLPIERGKISSDGKLGERELTVKVPISAPVADLFRIYPPPHVVNLTIRQGHLPNPDDPAGFAAGENFPVVWVGRVIAATRDGIECGLTCEALSAGMKRPGLRRHYQYACPLVLYGARCQASKSAATRAVTVASVTGNRVTLNSGWQGTRPRSAFVGGLFEWTSSFGVESRTILRVQTNTLVLSGPTFGLAAGASASAILGCPHTFDGCRDLHNNVVNYGGFRFIPGRNPVGKNNHF